MQIYFCVCVHVCLTVLSGFHTVAGEAELLYSTEIQPGAFIWSKSQLQTQRGEL